MLDKIRAVFLLVILFTSYVAIRQHIIEYLGEQSEQVQPVIVEATEKPKAKKVKQGADLLAYPPPPDEPILPYPAPGYPAPPETPYPTATPMIPHPPVLEEHCIYCHDG